MKLATWGAVALILVAALGVATGPARADDENGKHTYRIVVDRVTHEPAAITGTRLQLQFSALTLRGQRIDLTDPKSIKTTAGSSPIKAPFSLGRFGDTGGAMAIVIVVQTTVDYEEVLPVIAETLGASLVSKLPDATQVAVLAYGDSTGAGKLGSLKAARAKITQLSHDGTAGDPALLETVERGLQLLRKAKTDPEGQALRKLILVIGDGRDRAGDRERVTRVGLRAAKEGVRIHTFAHSPPDHRRPLLLLGELSRRSLGTFRWLQRGKADSWTPAFTQMYEEIVDQYVLTYYLSADEDPSGRRLRLETVGRTETSTQDRQPTLKIPQPECNNEPCAGYCVSDRCVLPREAEDRGIIGWILLIGGIALAVIVGLGLIGYALSKRAPRIPLPPGVMPPGVMPPGVMPPGGVPGMMPPGVMPPGAVPGMPGFPPPPKKRWWQRSRPAPMPMVPGMPGAPGMPGVPGSVPPATTRALMFLSGPRMGERVPLRHGFLIGKAPGCDLLIEDGYTSSHHAQITMDGHGSCKLYDQGSTNGTFVNGVRITETTLEHGVTIRFGSTDLRFLAE